MKFALRTIACLAVFASIVLMTGCAGPAPNYLPSIDNVEALKKTGSESIKTGTIAVMPGLKTGSSITLRADSMVPGAGSTFGDYIAAALRQELELAKLYNPQSPTEVSGTLLENDINAGGISTNDGFIAVQFAVKRGGQILFDKIKRITHQWEGSFVGGVAIPQARNNYPVMVQKLIAQLIADPDFAKAVGK